LILYELLGDKHPYPLDGEEYTEAINEYRAKPPKLDGDSGNNGVIEEILHRALDPEISGRPSVADLSEALRGGGTIRRSSKRKPVSDKTGGARDPGSSRKKRSEERTVKSATSNSLTLTDRRGKSIALRIRTSVGKYLVKTFGDDSRFWESEQFVLQPEADGSWTIRPNPSAGNETMLNGKAITSPCSLKTGDILAVGRESKGVTKLPLTVQIDEIV